MRAKWRIASIEVDRFRGVTGRVHIDFRSGLNLLAGDNGAGKTSLCHAVEWALFGKVPLFSRGDEFQAEDAIANRLVQDNAPSLVRLALERDGEQATITRTRPRGSSSTRGTSTVTLEVDGAAHRSRDAETKITELLGLRASDFSAGTYLRQETIADLVLGDEELRSVAIDRLLGLTQIRELLENLQLAPIERAIRQLDAEVLSQRDNVITTAAMRQVQLAPKRETFVAKGLDEAALSMTGAAVLLNTVARDLEILAQKCGAALSVIQAVHGTIAELQLSANELAAAAQSIDDALTERQVEVRQRNGRLEDRRNQFGRVAQAVRDLQTVNLDELKLALEALDGDVRRAGDDVARVRDLRLAAKPLCEQLDSIAGGLNALRLRVAEAEAQDLGDQKDKIEGEIAEAARLLERQSALDRLLAAAKDHLTLHPSNACPVCTQPIDSQQIVTRLVGLIAEGGQQSAHLAERLRELEAEHRRVGQRLEALAQDRASLERDEERWDGLVQRLVGYGLDVGDNSAEAVRQIATSVDEEYQRATAQQAALQDQHGQLQARAAGVESVRAELEGILASVKQLLCREDVPADVVAAITEALGEGERRLSGIVAARQGLRHSQEQLATAREIIGYLQDVHEVTELEQNVPPVRRRMRQLTAARARIVSLRQTVLEVYNALTAAQQEALTGNLAALMPGVQDVFTALGGHPEYRSLVIDPVTDEKSGTNIYRLRAQSEDGANGTFVRTTFSHAELNAVALALYMAVARAGDSNVAVNILDDPSQSLDPARQQALADVLQTLARERQVLVATEDRSFIERLTVGGEGHVIHLVHEPYEGVAVQG